MSYKERIKESSDRAHQSAIATKILDLMNKERRSSNDSKKRRWIWELIQNAKDVAFKNRGLNINIIFDPNESILKFQHNGMPFNVENITYLIEQVSSKDRTTSRGSLQKTTGKFGTGFLTTHLLSEKVQVSGVVKERDEELPCKQFSISLDRSGRKIEQIAESIKKSLSVLNNLDDSPTYTDYDEQNINTCFEYELNAQGKKVAKIGISDFLLSIPFTIAFSPKAFKYIALIDNEFKYEFIIENTISKNKLNTININISKQDGNQTTIIVVLSSKDVSIAMEVKKLNNGMISLVAIKDSMPRLFCDFPLIGSENFHFPVIVNCPSFSVTEPRDGVWLTEPEEPDDEVSMNKQYLIQARDIYFNLLELASQENWNNIYLLASNKLPHKAEWLDINWYKKHIQDKIKEKLLKTPIVDTQSGQRLSILDENNAENVYFPYHENNRIREKIWDIAYGHLEVNMPSKKSIHQWYQVITEGYPKVTIHFIVEFIHRMNNIKTLSKRIQLTETNTIQWLNSFYSILEHDNQAIRDIENNKFAIIPNQNGDFKYKKDLKINKGIENPLLHVLKILGPDWNDIFLMYGIDTGSTLLYPVKDQITAISEINKILRAFESDKKNVIYEACDYLSACFSDDETFSNNRNKIYDYTHAMWGLPQKIMLEKWDNKIWEVVDVYQVDRLIKSISTEKTIDNLSIKLKFEKEDDTADWLKSFIIFLTETGNEKYLNTPNTPILPNQNGVFLIKDEIFLEGDNIPDEIKDIARDLGEDVRTKLLHKKIVIDLPANRHIHSDHIAKDIQQEVQVLFTEIPREKKTKIIFNKLYIFIVKNSKLAEDLFTDLYKNKHRLIDDEQIAETMRSYQQIEDCLNEINAESDLDVSVMDILNFVKTKNIKNFIVRSEDISDPNMLIGLGVGSPEELDAINQDVALDDFLYKPQNPSKENYEHVKKIIERAKNNILSYLSTLPEYDCSGAQDLSPTVIGGIKKEGRDMFIITRPSDNKHIVLYSGAEFSTLEENNSELWIQSGNDQPEQLTLGRILKAIGINKIPIS